MDARDGRQQPGRVIVLNGPSSVGKSTIGRALQHLLEPPPLFAQLDYFTPMLPPIGHIGMSHERRTSENAGGPEAPLRWVFPDAEGEPVRIEFGASGHRLVRGMHRAIAALARSGNDVILEHVLLYDEWKADLSEALADLDVRWIGLRCAPDELRAREIARGDRVVG